MKRSRIKNRRWLRSRAPVAKRKQKPRRKSKYRQRERFVPYMLGVKQLPCAALIVPGHRCDGPIESDHAGPRGVKQKAHDSTVIPLCKLAHQQRADFSGPFRSWDQQKMRRFLVDRISQTQRAMEGRGFVVPPMSPAELETMRGFVAAADMPNTTTIAPAARPCCPLELATLREDGNVDVRNPDAACVASGGDR